MPFDEINSSDEKVTSSRLIPDGTVASAVYGHSGGSIAN